MRTIKLDECGHVALTFVLQVEFNNHDSNGSENRVKIMTLIKPRPSSPYTKLIYALLCIVCVLLNK